jgi:excisionase family DNA binding protein
MTDPRYEGAEHRRPIPDLSQFDEYVTVQEVSEVLRVSKMTVYRLVRTKELDSKRIGRSIRIPVEDLERYLRE